MKKRFTDADKWKDDWFSELSDFQKLLWLFLLDECDHAGIWKPAFKAASFYLGKKITEYELDCFYPRIVKLESGDFFITGFCKFQYGELKDNNRATKSVIDRLFSAGVNLELLDESENDKGLKQKTYCTNFKRGYQGASKGLAGGLVAPKDKDKGKGKGKRKEKGKENSEEKSEKLDKINDIYLCYPRKEKKQKGFENLFELSMAELDKVSVAAKNYALICEYEKKEKKYIQQFSTFANNWEDFYEANPDEYMPPEQKTLESIKAAQANTMEMRKAFFAKHNRDMTFHDGSDMTIEEINWADENDFTDFTIAWNEKHYGGKEWKLTK